MDHILSLVCGEALRFTGAGVGVAVLDTGCFPHEDLEGRILEFKDLLHPRVRRPYDDNGHGTHVCGILAGSGKAGGGRYRGVAPGCSLIPVKVLDRRGNGFTSDVLAGLRWVRENRERLHIRIINISVGSVSGRGLREDSALVRGVDAAWDDGLVVVAAAGNMGPGCGTITTPGISRKVITVGCSDDVCETDRSGRQTVRCSGRGPTGACVCKPDVVAPGSAVVSCANGRGSYTAKSGSSMATPLVSGAIALLLEKNPALTNRDVKLLFRERSTDLGLPRNQQGWGLLNIARLLR